METSERLSEDFSKVVDECDRKLRWIHDQAFSIIKERVAELERVAPAFGPRLEAWFEQDLVDLRSSIRQIAPYVMTPTPAPPPGLGRAERLAHRNRQVLDLTPELYEWRVVRQSLAEELSKTPVEAGLVVRKFAALQNDKYVLHNGI